MRELFVDRDDVLNALANEFREDGLRLAIVFGRRRVGKTWLAKELMNEVGGHYAFIPECDEASALGILNLKLSRFCSGLVADSWEAMLNGLVSCAVKSGGLILIIDEFQRLGKGFASQLQALVDSSPDAPLKLLLLGSSVSVIERLAGPLGPLFGRGLTIRLSGFGFLESYVYLRERLGASLLNAFKLYSLFGGSPYNLSLIRSSDPASEVLNHIHSVYGRLYEEPILTLASETRELGVYSLILSAIASGRNSFSKLAQVVRRTSLIKYLELLRGLGILERLVPAGENPARTKKARYVITDPYWDYWFKAIYPRREEAEINGYIELDNELLQHHFSEWFERVVRELLSKTYGVHFKPWWSKEVEVDAAAIINGEAVMYEVKYSTIDEKEAKKELRKLELKAKRFPHRVGEIGLIAKEIEGNPERTISFAQLVSNALRKTKIQIKHLR